MASSPSDSVIESPGRPAVTGARAKSTAAPGVRRNVSPEGEGSPAVESGTRLKTIEEYREKLVEIYDKFAPAKIARVDALLEKNQGREDYLYDMVCRKYGVRANAIKAAAPKRASEKAPPVKSAPPPLSARRVNSKAAPHVHPPLRTKSPALKINGSADAADGKVKQNGKARASRLAAASARLLAEIDAHLFGNDTGFFDDPMGDQSSCSRSSGASESGESHSSDDESPRPVKSVATTTNAVARVNNSRDAAPASKAASKALPRDPPPLSSKPAKPAAPEIDKPERSSGRVEAKSAPPARSVSPPKPPPLRKAVVEEMPVPAPTPPVPSNSEANGGAPPVADDPEDSDFDDEDLSAALAAGLGKNEAASPEKPVKQLEPSPARAKSSQSPPPRGRDETAEDDDAASKRSGNSAPSGRSSKEGTANSEKTGKPDGRGAPPPLNTKGANNGSKQKGNDQAAAKKEPPAPPLFDQWLAVLKFLTGWNDQRSYTTDEITGALKEHLVEEGIENSQTTKKLTATIVPLLSDLRRIDVQVMKNIKKDVLKSCKIIQIYILRIVTFELCRERDSGTRRTKKKKSDGKDGAPYLAGDISSLAKTVQHFRFESTFSGGLQKLITTIRKQMPAAPKPSPESDAVENGSKRKVSDSEAAARQAAADAALSSPKRQRKMV